MKPSFYKRINHILLSYLSRIKGCLLAILATILFTQSALAATYSNRYRSPRNPERNKRTSTSYIILHTTEAEAKSALNKLKERGEAHYCVTRDGTIYRIIDKDRVAYHCGRSMWNGRTNIDQYSVGIEIIGYHDKPLTNAQYTAVRGLVKALQSIYAVKDYAVMPHSQVAYGTPNRWHRKSHRGRKRCGMSFATPQIRAKLGLSSRYKFDPDVKAKRLVVADQYLANILFSASGFSKLPPCFKHAAKQQTKAPPKKAPLPTPVTTKPSLPLAQLAAKITTPSQSAWDIARDAYNAPTTFYILPNGKRLIGSVIKDWEHIPSGTQVIVTDSENAGDSAQEITASTSAFRLVGDEALLPTTYYILPNGGYRRGSSLSHNSIKALPQGTLILSGYKVSGPVTKKLWPSQIQPDQWNDPETYYLINKKLTPRGKANLAKIPPGTMIFTKE